MKRKVAVLIVALVAVLLFTACAPVPTPVPAATPVPPTKAAAATAAPTVAPTTAPTSAPTTAPTAAAVAPTTAPTTAAVAPTAASTAAATKPAATAAAPATGAAALTPVKLNVAYLPTMSMAVLFVAMERGFFAEQGITPNMTRVNSGSEAMAFLASGQMDAAGGALVASSYTAVNNGFDLRIVASGSVAPSKGGPNLLLVRKDLADTVKKPADLKGKKVAVSGGAGSGGAFTVAIALQGSGVSVNDLQLVNLANPDMVTGMASKSIDACYVGSPYSTQIMSAGTATILAQDITAGQMVIVYMMSGKFLRETPAVATRFMVAMLKASRAMQGDEYLSAANMAAYVKWTGAKEEDIRKTPAFIYDPNLRVLTKDIVDGERINREVGWTEFKTPMDTTKMVDLTPLNSALKVLGEIPFELPK